MNFFVKASCVTLLLACTSSYALNPVEGLYAGIFIGGSKANGLKFNAIHPFGLDATVNTFSTLQINYSTFGQIGGQVGYRCEPWRVELEPFYNSSPYNTVTIDGVKITKLGNPKHNNIPTGLKMKGQTNTWGLMLNGYYDAFELFDGSNFVPFVGLGFGYANIQNGVEFYYNNTLIANSKISLHDNEYAGQILIGVNYYLDDFTMFGLDFRYFATRPIEFSPGINKQRFQFPSINLSFNGSFDFG